MVNVDFFAEMVSEGRMLIAEQCRAARAFLDWKQEELAEKAGISLSTVRDFEAKRRTPHASNLAKLASAFAAAGVEFINDGDAPGIRGPKPAD